MIFILQDIGIGMIKEEMIENFGIIVKLGFKVLRMDFIDFYFNFFVNYFKQEYYLFLGNNIFFNREN